eukprot:93806_1
MGNYNSIGLKTEVKPEPGDFYCWPIEFNEECVIEPLLICGRAWLEFDAQDNMNKIVGQAGFSIDGDALSDGFFPLPFRANGKTNFQSGGGDISSFYEKYCDEIIDDAG